MKLKKLSLIFIAGLMVACLSEPGNELVGKWRMYKVVQNGQDVTPEYNPNDERYLILKRDSTFESGGRPFGKNTGKYIFNTEAKTLLLDSDAGPKDDSQWIISIKGDTMHWRGYGSEWAENFILIHLKENK